jgi:hypothetical protein
MAPQFDRELRELLRAAGCMMVRQGRGIRADSEVHLQSLRQE